MLVEIAGWIIIVMITITIMMMIIIIEKRKTVSCTVEALGQLSRTEQNSCVGGNSSPGDGQSVVSQPKLLLSTN